MKGGFDVSGGQLLEVTEQQDVKLAESIATPVVGPLGVVNDRERFCNCAPAVDVNHGNLEARTKQE